MRRATIPQVDAPHPREASATQNEAALIDRVACRDGVAFELLYRGYYPRLRRFIERLTRRPQIADEVLNDTMFVVWRRAGTYNLRSKVSTWIFGIAYRRALKTLKRLDEPVEFDADKSPDVASEGPEGAVIANERRARLSAALSSLSTEHRAVIELTYYEGCSCADVAAIMRCPVNTVKTRMFHARRRLRALLEEGWDDHA